MIGASMTDAPEFLSRFVRSNLMTGATPLEPLH